MKANVRGNWSAGDPIDGFEIGECVYLRCIVAGGASGRLYLTPISRLGKEIAPDRLIVVPAEWAVKREGKKK